MEHQDIATFVELHDDSVGSCEYDSLCADTLTICYDKNTTTTPLRCSQSSEACAQAEITNVVQGVTLDPYSQEWSQTVSESTLDPTSWEYSLAFGPGSLMAFGAEYRWPRATITSSVLRNNYHPLGCFDGGVADFVCMPTGFGGAITSLRTSLSISHSTISGNSASSGGGIFVAQNRGLVVSHTTINDNEARERGGGVYLSGGDMYISFTAFSRNWAQVGGAIFGQDECIITLVYSTLAGNWANNPSVPDHHLESWGDQDEDPYRGGGIFIWFGDLVSKPSSSSCRFCAICALSMLSETAHVGFVDSVALCFRCELGCAGRPSAFGS